MNFNKGKGLLLVASRKAEINNLLSKLNFQADNSRENIWHLADSGEQITAFTTGIGDKNVKNTINSRPNSFFERPIFITGTCGATGDQYEKHELFFPDTVSGPNSLQNFQANNILQKMTKETLQNTNILPGNITSGLLYSVNSPVVKADERRRMRKKFSAEAIDMETYPLLNELKTGGMTPEWFSFRIISDTGENTEIEDIKKLQNSACKQLNNLLVKLFKTPAWLKYFSAAASNSL
ncbi:MAG: hypothetical protein ACQEP7_00050 [bacterium]